MGAWVLREEGRAPPAPPGAPPSARAGRAEPAPGPKRTSLVYHPGINVLVVARDGDLRVLDVNSGALLHRAAPGDGDDPVGVQYLAGSDRIVFWNESSLGVRADYNGVLLLHTVLQRPLTTADAETNVKIELFLSEAILLYQCMKSVELSSVECAARVLRALGDAIDEANESPKKGIKAQKWSTICLELPYGSLKSVASTIVTELKKQKRHVPALAIASALNQQVSDLMPGSGTTSQSPQESMFSEAARRETFKKWPHMDYKWALPAQMAQAGFSYQPAINGDDRAMCFVCHVCLVCWEKTDEPWSEHERHSPDCALVKGEYTHNVPLSVSYATGPAVSHPGIAIVSKGNSGDIFLTGTVTGKVSIWNVDCKLKLQQEFHISIDEPLLQSKLYGPYSSVRKAWSDKNTNDSNLELKLTSLTIVGRCQNKDQPCSKTISSTNDEGQIEKQCLARPSIVCGVKINTGSALGKTVFSIWNDTETSIELKSSNSSTDKSVMYSIDGIQAMNDQNQAKSNNSVINSSYLVVYDFQGKCAQTVSPLTNGNGSVNSKNGCSKSGGSKKCGDLINHICRTEDSNFYDDIYFPKYMCLDEDLSQEMALVAGLPDQVTVIDLKGLVGNKEMDSKFNQAHDSNAKSSTASNNSSKHPLQKCIQFISKVNLAANSPQSSIAIHPILESQGYKTEQYEVEPAEKLCKPLYTIFDSEQPEIKPATEADALVLDTKIDEHCHELACIAELMYEYKNSGIKMKMPYCKASTAKNSSEKSDTNESLNEESARKEEVSLPPVCRAVQCLQLPPGLSARSDLTISHVLPTNEGDYLLVVVTCETVTNIDQVLVNGIVDPMELDSFECSSSNMNSIEGDIYSECVYSLPTSFFILYSLKFDSFVTLINDTPFCIKEVSYGETPIDICLLPKLEKSAQGIGLAATVGRDGALRLLDLTNLETITQAEVDSHFVSLAFCTSLEKLCACTEKGSLYFYAVRDNEGDSNEELDEEDAYLNQSEQFMNQQETNIEFGSSQINMCTNQTNLIAHKANFNDEDFCNLVKLAGIDGKGENVIGYGAVVSNCWCELLPTQRSRSDNQHFYRSWRLQNTSSTWDEHVLELTLPWSLSISHVEFKFSLHAPCTTPPNIQVTLLKQHLHGIGHRKDSAKCFSRIDDQIDFNLIESESKENPVRSKEYLRAHNAEILAGPLSLAQDLDLTQQGGTLTLTSPRLYRARGRTLLIHIKTLFDPSKDINQGKVSSSKKTKLSDNSDGTFAPPGSTVERFVMPSAKKKVESYIGCDWLHEICITVFSNMYTDIPHERLQRVAMLESNIFFENLLSIASKSQDKEKQSTALDLLIWIVSVRMTRFRSAKSETDSSDTTNEPTNQGKSKSSTFKIDIETLQHETIKLIQKNTMILIKNCILLAKRSIAKKCVKLILICCKGAKNLDSEASLQFEMAILESVSSCLPLIGAVHSAGSLSWFAQLVKRSIPIDFEMRCATMCMQLLKDIASLMQTHYNPYHLLLRSRFGLYGLPMESSLFDIELPVLGKTLSVPLTYASVAAGDTSSPQAATQHDIDLRDLYNYSGKNSSGWWCSESSVCGNVSGLSEVMPLRVTLHNSSDGTLLDTASTQQTSQSVFSINSDYSQFWDMMTPKETFVKDQNAMETDTLKSCIINAEMNQNTKLNCTNMECETTGEFIKSEEEIPESPSHHKDTSKVGNGSTLIPWQLLVQQPPQPTFVIKRMHPGARHFIVLDFGQPVKLTDLIIPACSEVTTLSVDVWLTSEDRDCVKIVLAPDISTKNLVMTDIQPAPVCQYLKITTIGRYNMSTTRCKIPLGWFFGEIADFVFYNEPANTTNLIAFHQDLLCRFRLAVGKLTDCLDFYLEMYGGSSSHMTADVDQQNDSYPLVRSNYQECLELQQQITIVENIMEKLNIFNKSENAKYTVEDLGKHSSLSILKQSSVDKLKTITEQLTDVLLHICFECESSMLKRLSVNTSISTCNLITKWLIVCSGGGSPRLEAGLASVLVRLCSSQPWWGTFIAETLAQLYSPSNTLIFSQNRVLILLVYMGRKSLLFSKVGTSGYGGGVVECVSHLVARLLPSADAGHTSTDPVWQTTDLALLGWLLIYLSACLDTAQPKEGSLNAWLRWNFLSSGNSNNTGNNSAGNNGNVGKGSGLGSIVRFHRRKMQKKLVHKVQMEELEAVRKAYQVSQQVQALSALSSQAASLTQHLSNINTSNILQSTFKNQDTMYKPVFKHQWVKRFEDFLQHRLSTLNKRVAGHSSSVGNSSRQSGSGAGTSTEHDSSSSDGRPTHLISQQLALQVSRSLISLILSMDFTCNTDVLLLACKVIGRLNGICGGLSNVVKEHEVLELMRAACSPAPWHQHALLMLLQDLVEYDRTGCRTSYPSTSDAPLSPLPLIQTDSAEDNIQWNTQFSTSDNRSDAIASDVGSTPSNDDGAAACGSNDYSQSPIIESDEDFDLDDLLDEMPDKIRNLSKDVVPKPQNNHISNGSSIAIDARLSSGIEISGEVLVRQLALLGGGSLAAAIHSQPVPSNASVNATPPTEVLPPATGDLTNMLIYSFHTLFTELEVQDNSNYLERVLQLWITLNGCSCGVSLNSTSSQDSLLMPKIKLSSQAVISIIHALNQQVNIPIRCWVLAFQCLSWVSNSPGNSPATGSVNPEGMAGVMLEDSQFIEMLVKFLSSNMEGDIISHGGERACAGPVACATMACLLQRISSRAPATARNAFLKALCQLTAPSGALRNGRGPPDAQKELLRVATPYPCQYTSAHLPEAMSLIESIGVIINLVGNPANIEMYGFVEPLSSVSSVDLSGGVSGSLGGLLAEALGVPTDVVRRERPATRRDLIISLIIFARSLILIPLRDVQMGENPNPDESQTDESKASQQNSAHIDNSIPSTSTSTPKIPCLADTVLQHYPSMKRIFRALSTCSISNVSFVNTSNCEMSANESMSFGDALFKFVITLVQTATHPKLILTPLLDYLVQGALSEALVRFILRSLEIPEALNIFVQLGGIEVICTRLIASHKSQLSPQPGLVAALMNHLKQPSQINNLSTSGSSSSEKAQASMEISEGLLNYAPLGTITSSNPTAQQADALLTVLNNGSGNCGGGGGGGAHRRTRSAAWAHHFGRGEISIDLSIKLPHAILLHEVQLQPHLSTLSTCPSAVSLEICSQGSVMTPLGPPQPTAGMTYIRLKLANPLVVNNILLRLYRPRDNSNLGLLNIRILGTAAFTAPSNDKAEEKLAASSAGWAVLLWSCLCGPENPTHLEARQRASSIAGLPEATTGLLLSAVPPSATLRSLLLALGSERSTALRVLTLMLHNAHIPVHRGYQQSIINTKSATDCICDLLYQLCTIQDVHSSQRIKTFIDRLRNCGQSVLSCSRQRSSNNDISISNTSHGSKYLSPAYIQCLASILWSVNEQQIEFNLKELITVDLFDIIYEWIEILPKFAAIKRSLSSVLCSLCYIKPELFTRMLQRMKILVPDTSSEQIVVEASISDDRKDLESRVAVTDDIKVHRGSNLILKPSTLEDLILSPSQLMTISIACMSPEAIKSLLKSNLLTNITAAIKTFCLQQSGVDQGSTSLTDSDKCRKTNFLVSIEMMPELVEWLSNLCIDVDIKNWLGGPVGSVFWKPLLMILCLPLPSTKNWQKSKFYIQLEEKTIKLFGSLVLCHSENQKLFAKTLYDVIKCHPESGTGNSPVSGFTRGLLLRLLLRNERISVAIRIKGNSETYFKDANTTFILRYTSTSPLPPKYLATHPSLYGCVILSLPHQTQLSEIISQHLLCNGNTWTVNETNTTSSNLPKKSSTNMSFGDGSSNSQSCTGAIDAWELSVAAANTAKDKRTKDARNLCAKQAMMLHCKKKGSSQRGSSSNKKDEFSINCYPSLFNSINIQDSLSSIKVLVSGLDGYVSLNTTLGMLCSAVPHKFGPQLNLSIIAPFNTDSSELKIPQCMLSEMLPLASLLNIFVSVGGLALLAHHLPPVSPPLPLSIQPSKDSTNTDEWVKLDDVYEDVAEAGSNSTNDEASSLIPAHSLFALGLLLRLPGYAEALLKEGQKAVYLLRLLLGVTDDGEGKDIMAVCGSGLGTLSFKVLGSLLESLPLSTDDGMLLRSTLLQSGTLRLLLVCLAVFTHQQPDSPPSETTHANGAFSKTKAEEKSKLYWAKGTGFGTGSTQQSWNVEESLLKQKTEEEHVTVLLQVIASYIQPGEKWNIGEQTAESSTEKVSGSSSDMETQHPCLPEDFITIIHQSVLLPAISSYLRNDSVLDMSRHIPLYLAVMRVVRAVMTTQALCSHSDGSSVPVSSLLTVIPQLLHQMSCTVDTYAKKLKMNKKTAFGKSYNQKSTSSNNDGCEDDEGLALLIPDIQATSALIQQRLGMSGENRGLMNTSMILRAPSTATREARYLEVMKRLQFETFEIIGECPDNGLKFNVPYHFESTVRAAGENSHPARMKRLAQEAVTLSTSLPLSYSSSVFVRTDQDRLDVMKVLITGPSDTPYANGCFELDVYFPMDYPNTPMLINLETTGRHSVRFNPNLYLDGKVCLSVLNTWHGRPEEQWNAQTSSFLQVLVSIQSLILVPEPYFNEPGFERSRGTPGGTHHSLEYNSNIYQACVRWAMLEQLRNPTSCFRHVIQTHFWLKRDEICSVIEGWIDELEKQAGDKRTQRNIRLNMTALKRHYKHLREELAKLTVPPGLEDLETPFSATCATQDSSAPLASPICVPDQQNQDMEVDMDQLIKKIVSEAFE